MMVAFLQAIGVALLALAGVALGRWCSRLPGSWWSLGYILPLLVIVLVAIGNRKAEWQFVPPFSWLMTGRAEFALTGFAAAWMLTTPLSRLPRPRDRFVVAGAMVFFVATLSVWPFLAPGLIRERQLALETRVDDDGICRQSTKYNCGPAAAVTALRRLGLSAEEGDLAVLAYTTPTSGTAPDLLCRAIERRFADADIECVFRSFGTIDDLRLEGIPVVVVKLSFLIDHYVAVLEVDEESVLVGDPLSGLQRWSREEFERRWRKTGIVIRRPNPPLGSVHF
jgi:predicted double-glycine peptidase